MKKEYMKPVMRIVELKHKCHLLAGSLDKNGMNKKLMKDEEVEDAF